jgi:tetratricopeptide (TPR) repeat protein
MKVLRSFFLLFLLVLISCISTGEKKEKKEQTEEQTVSETERDFSFAYEHMKQGNYNEAIPFLEKVIKADSLYVDAYLALNEAYQAVGDTNKALTIFNERVGSFPDEESNRKIVLAYATLLDDIGEFEKAERLFLDNIEKNPTNAQSHDIYASFLEAHGRFTEAVENYKKAYQYDPGNSGIAFRYGNLLFKLERYREAVELLKKAKETFVDDIEIIKKLAECYSELGQNEKAIEEYKSIIKIIPRHVSSRIQIGNVYLKMKKYREAESYYNEALKIEPDNLSVYYQLINLELIRKNLSGAKKYIDEGFSVDPNDGILLALYGEYYYRLGLNYMQDKKWRSSKEEFEEAIRIWKKAITKTNDSKWINYAQEGILRALKVIEEVKKNIW